MNYLINKANDVLPPNASIPVRGLVETLVTAAEDAGEKFVNAVLPNKTKPITATPNTTLPVSK